MTMDMDDPSAHLARIPLLSGAHAPAVTQRLAGLTNVNHLVEVGESEGNPARASAAATSGIWGCIVPFCLLGRFRLGFRESAARVRWQ